MKTERFTNIGVIIICVVTLAVLFTAMAKISDKDELVKNLSTQGK